jgi:Domain of unknown function (DUF4281)
MPEWILAMAQPCEWFVLLKTERVSPMDSATIFLLSNVVVMPFWLLMIVLPRWQWTQRIVASPLIAAPPALLYALMVLPQLATLFPAVSNPDLAALATMLGTPAGTAIAWAHFVAFDLLVGRWAYLDSRERNVHPLVMAPVLFFILMLGPIGYLAYLVARSLSPQAISRNTTVPA